MGEGFVDVDLVVDGGAGGLDGDGGAEGVDDLLDGDGATAADVVDLVGGSGSGQAKDSGGGGAGVKELEAAGWVEPEGSAAEDVKNGVLFEAGADETAAAGDEPAWGGVLDAEFGEVLVEAVRALAGGIEGKVFASESGRGAIG